jgi:hypothetical protein
MTKELPVKETIFTGINTDMQTYGLALRMCVRVYLRIAIPLSFSKYEYTTENYLPHTNDVLRLIHIYMVGSNR